MLFDITPVIDFIIEKQNSDGGFTTYELYPVVKPNDDWAALSDPSPFITSNILYSLTEADDQRLNKVIHRAAKHLYSLKEHGAYWRFWPKNSKQHPVLLDMDDTCLVSFLLKKLNYPIINKRTLLYYKNAAGYLKTWLSPTLPVLFSNPLLALQLYRDLQQAKPTILAEHFTLEDFEPAVAANALLYLGENTETISCIHLIIKEIIEQKMNLQFYADELVVYYHISRAYKNGISSFKQISDTIIARVKNRFTNSLQNENELCSLMAANIALNFNSEHEWAQKLIAKVAEEKISSKTWNAQPYFASKNRNFFAGSPELAAALFIECACKINRHYIVTTSKISS